MNIIGTALPSDHIRPYCWLSLRFCPSAPVPVSRMP